MWYPNLKCLKQRENKNTNSVNCKSWDNYNSKEQVIPFLATYIYINRDLHCGFLKMLVYANQILYEWILSNYSITGLTHFQTSDARLPTEK